MKKIQEKHKILIPLFYDYHLFGYLERVIPKLAEHGFDVCVLTADPHIEKRYNSYGQKIRVSKSFHVRAIEKLMQMGFLRVMGWIYGWIWSYFVTFKTSAILLPRDTRPLQYLIGCWRPSVLVQPSLGKYTKLYLHHKYGAETRFPIPKIDTHFPIIDKVLGGGYLRSVSHPMKNKIYAVIGNDSKEFYEKIGAAPARVRVLGNPNYDGLALYKKDNPALDLMREKISYKDEEVVLSFFPSQLTFSDDDIQKLTVFAQASRAVLVIKPHPRICSQELAKLKMLEQRVSLPSRVVVMEGFRGEDNNVRLMSLSDAVLVEESNVGILAAYLQKPLLILTLSGGETHNFFKLFDIVEVDERNISEFQKGTHDLSQQEKMIKSVAKRLEFPHTEIVRLLEELIEQPEDFL